MGWYKARVAAAAEAKPAAEEKVESDLVDGDVERAELASSPADSESDYHTVGWYDDSDPENLQMWLTAMKPFTYFQICLLTFATIITPAEPVFIKISGVLAEVSSLVLSMYVLGYGAGPLFFSPISEVPRLGRNIRYFVSFSLFIIITAIISRVSNFPGLVVLRFIQGFLGGPVLATGGASASVVLSFLKIPYGLILWGAAAFAGPAFAPLLDGFSVPLSTWGWSIYELLILCCLSWILLFFCLPEMNADYILLNRAKRLRKLTDDENWRSESEVKQRDVHFLKLLGGYLTQYGIRPSL
ncbi:MAG: hypothetical protein M1818_002255 [Claussenomyces sp. TS43310]|nr:MAG: hypothetical protein M1818_002255 [Claussenomyces sp. TS43310]